MGRGAKDKERASGEDTRGEVEDRRFKFVAREDDEKSGEGKQCEEKCDDIKQEHDETCRPEGKKSLARLDKGAMVAHHLVVAGLVPRRKAERVELQTLPRTGRET